MGVIIRGNNIEFEGNTYRVVEQYAYTKFDMLPTNGLIGKSNGVLRNAGETSLRIKIRLADMYLINSLDPQGVFEPFPLQNINLSLFSFSGGYICLDSIAGGNIVFNFNDCATSSFSKDSEFLYIDINFVAEGTALTTANGRSSAFTSQNLGSIWNFVKYNNKYVVIPYSTNQNSVVWGAGYTLSSRGNSPSSGSGANAPQISTSNTLEIVQTINSNEDISPLYELAEQNLYTLLWNYGFSNTSGSNSLLVDQSNFSFSKTILKKDIEL